MSKPFSLAHRRRPWSMLLVALVAAACVDLAAIAEKQVIGAHYDDVQAPRSLVSGALRVLVTTAVVPSGLSSAAQAAHVPDEAYGPYIDAMLKAKCQDFGRIAQCDADRSQWMFVKGKMQEAIKVHPHEAWETDIRVGTRPHPNIPYLPFFYLGLANHYLKDYRAAVDAFRRSEASGALRGAPLERILELDPVRERMRNRVVVVDGQDDQGFGFVVGERDEHLFIVTANHVVRAEGEEAGECAEVMFFFDEQLYSAKLLPRFEPKPGDLAVLSVKKPQALDLPVVCAALELDDYLPSGRHHNVWFVGRNRDWYIPGVPGGITSVRHPTIEVTNVNVQPGSSGAPLVSELGLIGMIQSDSVDEARAVSALFIRERLRDWGVPWGLEPCPQS